LRGAVRLSHIRRAMKLPTGPADARVKIGIEIAEPAGHVMGALLSREGPARG